MDEFADLDLSDFEDDSAIVARRARIEAARLKARDYSAKLDEPGVRAICCRCLKCHQSWNRASSPPQWYLTSEAQSNSPATIPPRVEQEANSQLKDLHRRKVFAIQHHYLQRAFLTSLNLAIDLLNDHTYIRGEGSEDVEVLDLILGSFLKLWQNDRASLVQAPAWAEQAPAIVEIARKWSSYVGCLLTQNPKSHLADLKKPFYPRSQRGIPTYSFTASRAIFLLATHPSPPASIQDPQEPLPPILNALKLHSTQTRYLQHLEQILQNLDRPVLAKALTHSNAPDITLEDKRKAFKGLMLTEEERSTLEKVTGLRGEVKEEPEEDNVRDVRSL
ncbi:BQ2448_2019 [Microbotryum intermedium]|uniref:BQ2448_2019 protein n=1 Tax=Microbotryum intermedium TaxID=269621 RepID=A0A238F8B2_9BASI|nr:BQ2448_2019 [Microbotryum intermedium]